MPKIFEYISAHNLNILLEQYAKAFDVSVFVFDEKKQALLKFPEDAPESGLLLEPVILRDTLIGYVAVPDAGQKSKTSLDFIVQNISSVLEMGYEIESLSGEVSRNYEELSLLWELSTKLGAGLDVDRICNVLADEVMGICPSSNLSIMLLSTTPRQKVTCLKKGYTSTPDAKLSFLFPKVSRGTDASMASMMTLSAESGLFRDSFERKESITVCDVSQDSRFEGLPYPVTRILIVPLVVEEMAIGAIVASDKLDGEEFYTTEIKLISSIASECAISIKKALLYDEIHTMLFGTVEAFASALDAKHPYTYGHSKRVAEISVNIAKKMKLPRETINWIRLAALLHDVGKIGTPELILDKNSELDPEEMGKVREHPLIGSKMIEHVKKMRDIALWICHHHEKYDGTGYPSGLEGDEIPLPSRIIAIADYFDALTSDRPYREAFSNVKAVEQMKDSVGTHFDPVVFEHFISEVVPTL